MVIRAALCALALLCADPPAQDGAVEPKAIAEEESMPDTVLGFEVKDIDGNNVSLDEEFAGDVLLIVNTASECGLTPQYADLEALYRKYHEKGFEVLAFPSNDFGDQEPGSNAEIKEFCSTRYDVTFPLLSKVAVKGDAKTPLYRFLTDPETNPETAGEIQWNFTKFLVGRDGKIIARYEPAVKPTDEQVTQAVEKALAAQPKRES